MTYNIWNFTKDELTLDKYSVNKIESLLCKNYLLNAQSSAGISYMPKDAKTENLRDLDEFNTSVEESVFIQPDEDEDCSIIFERKPEPTTVRRRIYSLHKTVVPNPPRLRTPIAIFMAEFKPSEALLQDREFIHALAADLPSPPQKLTPEDFASNDVRN